MSSLPVEEHYVRFEVFTAVTMKNGAFWDVTPTSQKTPFFIVPPWKSQIYQYFLFLRNQFGKD
jgi:hypothetical protein